MGNSEMEITEKSAAPRLRGVGWSEWLGNFMKEKTNYWWTCFLFMVAIVSVVISLCIQAFWLRDLQCSIIKTQNRILVIEEEISQRLQR